MAVPFWIPTSSKKVRDDFRHIFGALDLKSRLYEMGSHPGCLAVLLKPIDDYESVWTDMRFIGKWRFGQQMLKDSSSRGDYAQKDKEYVECQECWYDLKHVETCAQILGGEPYFFIRGYSYFQPLVLVSEDYGHCGAIAILNRKRHPILEVRRLNEIACNVPLKFIRLSPQQLEQLRTRLGIYQASISISPHAVLPQNTKIINTQGPSSTKRAPSESKHQYPMLKSEQIKSLKEYLRQYTEREQQT